VKERDPLRDHVFLPAHKKKKKGAPLPPRGSGKKKRGKGKAVRSFSSEKVGYSSRA